MERSQKNLLAKHIQNTKEHWRIDSNAAAAMHCSREEALFRVSTADGEHITAAAMDRMLDLNFATEER